jgi:hypothetical protein
MTSGQVQGPMMHFYKNTLYNIIAHGKSAGNLFYGWIITRAS